MNQLETTQAVLSWIHLKEGRLVLDLGSEMSQLAAQHLDTTLENLGNLCTCVSQDIFTLHMTDNNDTLTT